MSNYESGCQTRNENLSRSHVNNYVYIYVYPGKLINVITNLLWVFDTEKSIS